jgi:hypothetical protein
MTAEQAALPDWAPKNPSPEFLRAAKVLKPMPLATFQSAGASAAENAAAARETAAIALAGYEFFGALTDEQVQQLLTSHPDWRTHLGAFPPEERAAEEANRKGWRRLLIPVKSLTPQLRAAFDDWAVAWGKARVTSHPDSADYLVALYKMGAKKDLSNVRVGFIIHPHDVGVISCITAADGKTDGMCADFAMR